MPKYIANASTTALFRNAPLIGLSLADKASYDTLARAFLSGPPAENPDVWFCYYSGARLLAELRLDSPLVDLLASTFMQAQRRGLVALRQRRTRLAGHTPLWSYEARLSPSGRVPVEALQSRVGSTPSPAFGGNAPAVTKDGSFAPPNRVERRDGLPRPSLDQLDNPNAPKD